MHFLNSCSIIPTIEEGFIKKPRQTVSVSFWRKMATHIGTRMLWTTFHIDHAVVGAVGVACVHASVVVIAAAFVV